MRPPQRLSMSYIGHIYDEQRFFTHICRISALHMAGETAYGSGLCSSVCAGHFWDIEGNIPANYVVKYVFSDNDDDGLKLFESHVWFFFVFRTHLT